MWNWWRSGLHFVKGKLKLNKGRAEVEEMELENMKLHQDLLENKNCM